MITQREIIVDNFAGGGGASTGIEMATGRSVDIAINHDENAIRMHKMNHPSTKHYCESVWDVDPIEACSGRPVALAWFSPDCKHFSKAKGSKPKDKKIRGLAWIALRWAAKVRPRVIMLENVEEFKTWGPLNRSHRPIKAKTGETFRKFVSQLEALGYDVEFSELVAADYGAPTKRKRFFMIARCDGKAIVWPEKTHAPADSDEVKMGLCKPYLGAYTQLDFSLPCPSIFESSQEIKEKYGLRAVRPLAEKTLQRIARGIEKYVIENDDPFIIQVNHTGSDWHYTQNIKEPLPVITSKHGFGVVSPCLVQIGQTGFSADRSKDVREPLTTIVSKNEHCIANVKLEKVNSFMKDYMNIEQSNPRTENDSIDVIQASHIIQMNNHSTGQHCEEPINTITAGDGHFGEVRSFLIKYYGQGTGQNIKEPLDTITANDRFGVVTVAGIKYNIDRDYSGKSYPRSEQVKRCGNAVPPPFAEALTKSNLPELCILTRMPNMRIDESEKQLKFA